MAGKIRIKRGDVWAERLKQQLAASAEGAGEWIEDHAQILNSTHDSLSGLWRVENELAYLKLYRFKSLRQKLLSRFGRSQSLRTFNRARELSGKEIPVPQPLACLMLKEGALLAMEGMSGGGNLVEIWHHHTSDDDVGAVMRATGETLGKLHAAGYCYGDSGWGKLYWNGECVYLTDLEHTRKCSVGNIQQSRDLARFTANAEELGIGLKLYDQFLEQYLQAVPGTRREVVERMIRPLYRIRGQHLSGGYGQRLV
ncbi:MAG: hypothetical protein KDI17_10265 [Halioglobus sp.]|nr:hypothetical protein [Halioglobus sp.]